MRADSLKPRIGLAVIRSPYEKGVEKAEEMLRKGIEVIEKKLGFSSIVFKEIIDNEEVSEEAAKYFERGKIDTLLIGLATWADDTYALPVIERLHNVSIVIWSWNYIETGSLVAGYQLSSILKDLNMYFKFVVGELDSPKNLGKLKSIALATAIKNKLYGAKIGIIGYQRIKGSTDVTFDELELRKTLGVRVVTIGIDDLVNEINVISLDKIKDICNNILNKIKCIKISKKELEDSCRIYIALKNIIKKYNLNAITVECAYKLLGRVCLPFSLLINEGYMCGCESDIRSTIVMLILRWLSDKPVLFAEPLFLDEKENSIIFSHCGAAPLSLANDIKEACITPMRLTGRGAVVTFTVKPQEYTLAALSGRDGNYRLLIGYGKGIPTSLVFEGNPAKISFKTSIMNIVEETTEEFGAGRHWILVPGNYVNELTELAKLLSFKYKIIL